MDIAIGYPAGVLPDILMEAIMVIEAETGMATSDLTWVVYAVVMVVYLLALYAFVRWLKKDKRRRQN